MARASTPRSSRNRRHGGAWREWAVLAAFGLFAVAGLAAAGLYAGGFFDQREQAGPPRPGMVQVVVLGRPVEAYSSVEVADLRDPVTGQLAFEWVSRETAQRIAATPGQARGRVLRRSKAAGQALSEADFFPLGTRPGLAAGIPPGMRAVSLETDQIEGLSLLRMGDTFDLIAALPAETETLPPTEYAVLLGGIKPPDTRAGQLAKQTGVRRLVEGGHMIALTRGQTRSTEGQEGLVVDTAARRSRETPVTIATIGVSPDEVTPLTEALTLETRIVCVAHSGHAEDDTAAEPPVDLTTLTPVVAPVRGLEPFEIIRQEDLVDSVSGRLNRYYFEPSRVQRDWLTDFADLVGRVPRRPIAAGEPLTEDDLMPLGTRPGVVAAAPPNTVVIQAASDRLLGSENLQGGDRISIYRTLPTNAPRPTASQDWATVFGGRLSTDDETLQETLRSGVQQVAADVVVLGRKPRLVDDGNQSGDRGEVLLLAVPRTGVVAVTQAIGSGDELAVAAEAATATPRRGSPSSEGSDAPNLFGQHSEHTVRTLPVALVHQRDDRLPGENAANTAERRLANDRALEEVAIPVTARPIEAFTKLSPADFVDPATGRLRVYYFDAEQVDPDWIRSVRDLVDRVTAVPIEPGRAVASRDLLPAGTDDGPPAGVPAGYVAIEVTSDQLRGLSPVDVLDRLDIVSARPIQSETVEARATWPQTESTKVFYDADADDVFSQALTEAICTGAIVISRGERAIETVETTQTEEIAEEVEVSTGTVNRHGVTRTFQPAVLTRTELVCTLAVRETDLPRLVTALALDAVAIDGISTPVLLAVLHSGRPDVAPPSIERDDPVRDWVAEWSQRLRQYLAAEPPAAKPATPPRQIEQIRGSTRTVAEFDSPRPVVAPELDSRLQVLEAVLPAPPADVQQDQAETGRP